jgi:hypothetical protein
LEEQKASVELLVETFPTLQKAKILLQNPQQCRLFFLELHEQEGCEEPLRPPSNEWPTSGGQKRQKQPFFIIMKLEHRREDLVAVTFEKRVRMLER